MCPQNSESSDGYDADSGGSSGYLCPRDRRRRHHALLDGNFVRRELPLKPYEYCVWDTELPGFGLRISPKGRYYWTVRLRHRGKQRRESLGRADDVDDARAGAGAPPVGRGRAGWLAEWQVLNEASAIVEAKRTVCGVPVLHALGTTPRAK